MKPEEVLTSPDSCNQMVGAKFESQKRLKVEKLFQTHFYGSEITSVKKLNNGCNLSETVNSVRYSKTQKS